VVCRSSLRLVVCVGVMIGSRLDERFCQESGSGVRRNGELCDLFHRHITSSQSSPSRLR